MIKSAIRQIFDARNDEQEENMSEEYLEAQKQASMLTERLTNTFSDEQNQIYEQLNLALMQIETESAATNFAEGFKLGILIGIECTK